MYNINNSWKYDKRSLFTTNDNYKLPSQEWQKRTELVNSFNNQLVSGFKQGLSLYDDKRDKLLFNNLDLDAIKPDKVNFDKINEITQNNYSKNDDIYHNAKSAIKGAVDQINKTANDTAKDVEEKIKNLFTIDTSNLKIYAGLILAFIFLNRK